MNTYIVDSKSVYILFITKPYIVQGLKHHVCFVNLMMLSETCLQYANSITSVA